MHEMSVVESMVKVVEKFSKGKEVTKVVAVIGKMSGIEPYFLKECFNVFKENTVCKNATLEIEEVNIKIRCFDCKSESEIKGFNFHCPKCKSERTEMIAGNEMYVKYIEVKE